MKPLLKRHQRDGGAACFDQRKTRERPSAAPRRRINLQLLQVAAVCDSCCQTHHLHRPLPPPARPFQVLSEQMKAWPRPLAHLRRSWGSCRRRSPLFQITSHLSQERNGVRLFLEACDESAAAAAAAAARSLSRPLVSLTEVVRAGRCRVYRLITHHFLSCQLEAVWLR